MQVTVSGLNTVAANWARGQLRDDALKVTIATVSVFGSEDKK